jgi:tetratricopeptide (TPR) repeat protein
MPLKSGFMRQRYFAMLAVGLMVLAMCGCGYHRTVSRINSPDYHLANGQKFLLKGMLPEAEREFVTALDLDSRNVASLVGLALVKVKQENFLKARQLLERASNLALDQQSQYMVQIAYLRMHTEEKGKDWLDEALKWYEQAVRSNATAPDAYYYMGVAYKESYNFQDAKNLFEKAREFPGGLQAEATREAALMETILDNPPQTLAGKKAVLAGRLHRAHMAALLVQELGLGQWITVPGSEGVEKISIPDIQEHIYRRDIETVAQWGIQGLELDAQGAFRPEEPLTRLNLAIIFQDVIIKATGKKDLAYLYQRRKNPFSDLPKESPYFNAAMLNVVLGIMPLPASDTEEFDPLGSVSGTDALRAIHQLKQKIMDIKKGSLFKPWKDLNHPFLDQVAA